MITLRQVGADSAGKSIKIGWIAAKGPPAPHPCLPRISRALASHSPLLSLCLQMPLYCPTGVARR